MHMLVRRMRRIAGSELGFMKLNFKAGVRRALKNRPCLSANR